MSFDAIRWALAQPVPKSSAKFLLVAMADCVNEQGANMTCWPSVAHLSCTTALDRKTVLDGMKRLQEAGFIEDTGERRGQTKQVIVYRLKEPDHKVPACSDIGAQSRGSSSETSPKTDLFDTEEDSEQATDGNALNVSKSTEIGIVKQSQKRNSTENGTVPFFPPNSPVFPTKQSRFSHETVPKTGHGTSKEPVIEPVIEPRKKNAREKTRFDPLLVTLPEWLPFDLWSTWVKDRADRKKPITEAAAKLQIRKLEEFRAEGYDPRKLIERSIERRWLTFFTDDSARIGASATFGVQRQGGKKGQLDLHRGFDERDYSEGVNADGTLAA